MNNVSERNIDSVALRLRNNGEGWEVSLDGDEWRGPYLTKEIAISHGTAWATREIERLIRSSFSL